MLKETQKISPKKAQALILDIARHSRNECQLQGKSDNDVQQFFTSHGYNWNILVESMRIPGNPLPLAENLIGSSYIVVGCGKHDTSTIMHHGKPIVALKGSGEIAMFDYHPKYDQAIACRKRAIKYGQYTELLNCVSNGIASIESYINTQAAYWNNNHPNDTLDVHNQDKLDTKLNDWLEKMTGNRLKNSSSWNHFDDYRTLNNKKLKHATEPAYAVSFAEMAITLNKFRCAIARTLFELHIAFKQMVPPSIIRGMYFPDVETISV